MKGAQKERILARQYIMQYRFNPPLRVGVLYRPSKELGTTRGLAPQIGQVRIATTQICEQYGPKIQEKKEEAQR